MLEKYYKYKISYKDYILLLRFGNFYEVLDKDAFICNKLFGFKLTKLSDTFKCGFPINSKEKITNSLGDNNINYIVVENDDILDKKSFTNNKYYEYDFDINTYKYNCMRVDKIYKYLNDNIFNNINELLDGIEEIIDGRG